MKRLSVVFAGSLLVSVSMIGSAVGSVGAADAPAAVATKHLASDTTGCVRNTLADQRFVALAYRVILGREGDNAGISYLAAKLAYPTSYTYQEVLAVLTSSSEYRRRVVRERYATILGRVPSSADTNYYVGWLPSHSEANLTALLVSSPEYWHAAGSNATGWVTHAFGDLLGRSLDPVGKSYWVARVNRPGATLGSVAGELVSSEEYRQIEAGRVYQAALGRSGDSAGIAYWAGFLTNHDIPWMFGQLGGSDEFWRRAQRVMGGTAFPQPAPCPKPNPTWPTNPQVLYSLKDYPSSASKLIALTFDDGPSPQWTQQILGVLAAKGVHATFFPIGSQAQAYPDLIRAELAAGHHVADHTWDHPSLPGLSAAAQANEISSTAGVVNNVAGKSVVHCVRPPYGNHSSTTDSIIAGMGMSTVLWSRDTEDWKRPGVSSIVANALDERYDGGRGIILMHDGGGNRSQSVAALGEIIDSLRARGYQFVTIC